MAEPGWYPDPTNHRMVRWFDGAAWTDHVSGPVPPAADVVGPVTALVPAPVTMPTQTFGRAPGSPALADFGTRLGAYVIDALIVVVPYWVAYNIAFRISIGLGVLVLLGGLALTVWYFATSEGGPAGQTIGKRQLGIAVVDATSLQPGIGAGRAIGRYFGRLLDVLVCGLPLGYLAMLWDDDNQTWHDKVASTKVVKL